MLIDNVEEMILRQLNNQLSKDELEELRAWYESSEENKKLYRDYSVILMGQAIASDKALFANKTEAAWKRTRKKMHKKREVSLFTPLLKYASVAAIALLIGVYAAQYLSSDPGIDDEILVEVPLGSKSKVQLPDGSSVWLNSGTRLTYTRSFGKTNRSVTLDGEGFFDIAKNKKMPFTVRAGETNIRVLGTQFNFKAYSDDERSRVTLLEGSLSVSLTADKETETLIVPNDQVVIDNKNSALEVRQVEAANYALWTEVKEESLAAVLYKQEDKNLPQMQLRNQTFRNVLLYDEETLSQIVKDLGRAFNVSIELADKEIANRVFYGDFRNEESLYEILDIITSSEDIIYQIKDNKITISQVK